MVRHGAYKEQITPARRGAANPLFVLAGVSLLLVLLLILALPRDARRSSETEQDREQELVVFCAAGVRPVVEKIAEQFTAEFGTPVQLQYGGSNTLLNQIEVGKTGDLFLAADEIYIDLAQERGMVQEALPLAVMRPVIVVPPGNPKEIEGVADLARSEFRVSMGNPDQAAIGRSTKAALTESGHWEAVAANVQENGVYKPTVPDVANDVKIGSADAAVIWDAVARNMGGLEVIEAPELESGAAHISIGVLATARQPTAALRFSRYLSAPEHGGQVFNELGYEAADGDQWAETPELTFFAGSVNRQALEPVIQAFEKREGARINTVYNGCGILTAQMRSMLGDQQSQGFPDMYMACDVYYLETVADLFQDAVNVSHTDIVIVVAKDNPKQIESLQDLTIPGVRVVLGQPQQCTIGVLSKRLLVAEGIYDDMELNENIVTETATSALLIPNVLTGTADAVLAYRTDTLAERNQLHVIPIDSPLARAVQPYSIARSSKYKRLGKRLFAAISQARDTFEEAGFAWDLPSDPPAFSENKLAPAEIP